MTAPFQFCGTTGGSGVSSKVAAVTVATAAGDALVIAVGIGGTSPPSVSGVTDSAGNTYSLAESVTASSPFLYVYAATGVTVALTTLSTVTVTFSGNTTGGFGITGTDCPGVAAVDVAQAASGSSGAPSVTGTPSQSGETALAAFAWGNTGAAGTISSPFTGCGQEHPSGGTYVTCAYDTSPASGSPLTAAASITSTAWRAILITFETAPPAGLWYMTNVAYIADMDSGNTSDTHALFSHAASFGISNSASTPGIPAGYACTPLLRYTSYAQLQADITASAISGSYTWLMYDTEDWSQTPQGEIDNPWTYMGDFVTLAHAHGYKAILAPALDLGNDATSVNPKMPGETDPAWYTRTNIAGTAAATGAEVIHIQAQSLTATGSYASFVASCMSQVIAGEMSGTQQVSVGISTAYGTPAQMLAAVQSATGASGVWLNATSGTISTAVAYEALAVSGGSPVIINQWAAAFAQPAAFGNMPPALQSAVIALDGGTSVGGGSGTPAPGSWLLLITGWHPGGTGPVTVGNADDIHSFWRPGDVTTSTWAVSAPAGATRTSVWYTPNLARVPATTYTAPNGVMAGMACLVIEVAGLGPWDVVTGISIAYAAAATALTLSLPAPSAQAFVIGAVTGDNAGAFQSFAPAGWTALQTVVASNGVDTTCDAVLTSACIITSGSVSVSAASTTEDLSGVIIGVQTSAASPIPAGHNPNWPLVKFEVALGGGFQTPPDELTWYDLSDRLWSWDETTGVQYQLGDLQATNLDLELDNYDNALASDNVGSPYYSSALNENMSFAAGIAPWAATGSSALAWSSAQAYSSSPGAVAFWSLQVTPNGSTASPGAVSEHIPVSASTAYSPAAWFYSPGGYATGAEVAVTWYTSGGSSISTVTSSAVVIPAAAWTQVTTLLDQTSPSNAATAVLTVKFAGTPSATPFWVAEAALAKGASPVATGLITTGVPVRIRAACGTIGGVVDNRWRIIQRNAENWEQQVDEAFRRFAAVTATDIWSTMSNIGVTPYRGEVIQDHPYAWWPLDDQLVEGGVLPVIMRNAASGNTNVLSIALSPAGAMDNALYSTQGLYNTYQANSVALYTVAALQGWMPGDPQSSAQAAQSTQSGNATTAQPGSAAWQQAGMIGGTGSQGWYLACQDAGYPSVTGGVTIEGWWNYGWFGGTASGAFRVADAIIGTAYIQDIANQPYCPLTLFTITSASAMVAELQLDLAGHLTLNVTESGTPTAYSIYTATDLRSASWHHYALALTTTGYTVWIDGGQTATVSGTLSGVAASFSWLVINGDMGANAASDTSAYESGANVAVSHVAVYPAALPAYRIWSHYVAAVTGFGLIPAATAVAATFVPGDTSAGWSTDGTPLANGTGDSYGSYGGAESGGTDPAPNAIALSAIVTADLGAYTSGPSAWTVVTAYSSAQSAYVGWTGLAPGFTVYTGNALGDEAAAATVCGVGDTFYGGYGSSADGTGPAQAAGGTGASPPTSPSALGDTVQQRLERVMAYGLVTYPGRCIDPAPLLVQGATDVGGQGTADNFENLTDSDGGLTFVDNNSNLTYWQRPHLASQYASPVWEIGPASSPYYREIKWIADSQRIWNSITITPFSPDDALLPLIIPAQAAQVLASQEQFGAQSKQVTSYLQSQAEMQLQANSLLTNFGTLHIRAENVKLDAAPDPSLWPMILGVNVADLATIQMWQIGGGGITWTLRISEIKRHVEFNGDTGKTEASATLKGDFEPTYWS